MVQGWFSSLSLTLSVFFLFLRQQLTNLINTGIIAAVLESASEKQYDKQAEKKGGKSSQPCVARVVDWQHSSLQYVDY